MERGRKITDPSKTLDEILGNKRTLFFLFDEKKEAAHGAVASGANGVSSTNGVKAQAGGGSGASRDENGNLEGGSGFGGDGRGKNFVGTAGSGFGGTANTTVAGKRATGGTGAGGDIVEE